jgi:hypothetical protein
VSFVDDIRAGKFRNFGTQRKAHIEESPSIVMAPSCVSSAEKRWPDAVMTNSGVVLGLAKIAERETLGKTKGRSGKGAALKKS